MAFILAYNIVIQNQDNVVYLLLKSTTYFYSIKQYFWLELEAKLAFWTLDENWDRQVDIFSLLSISKIPRKNFKGQEECGKFLRAKMRSSRWDLSECQDKMSLQDTIIPLKIPPVTIFNQIVVGHWCEEAAKLCIMMMVYWFTVKSFVIGIYFKSNNNKTLFSFLIAALVLVVLQWINPNQLYRSSLHTMFLTKGYFIVVLYCA